jgi:1,4-dihydroxy-2-naphthoate octaprenyltransferase
VILHLLIYPASNAYNSYYDKDEGSIGLLKRPPKVNQGVYWAANVLDLLGLYLSFTKIGLTFMLLVLGYILVSRAYSYPGIRLKKHPWYGWLAAGFFQGFYTFMMVYIGINGFGIENFLRPQLIVPAFLSSILLWGSFPLTQVYQHGEDEKRGDQTISRLLGVLGTFHFAVGMFLIANLGFILYFDHFHASKYALIFQFFLAPIVMYFMLWYLMVRKHPRNASYTWAMGMNFAAALSLNAFFIWFWIDRTNLLQVFF